MKVLWKYLTIHQDNAYFSMPRRGVDLAPRRKLCDRIFRTGRLPIEELYIYSEEATSSSTKLEFRAPFPKQLRQLPLSQEKQAPRWQR